MYGLSDFTTELEDIHYSPGYITELEHKIQFLEKQGQLCREYKLENDRLQMELHHITTLKDTYEEKYNEASMKLLYIEDDDSMIFSESEQINTLNQKIAILLHANQDLLQEIEEYKHTNESITKEKTILELQNAKLEHQLMLLTKQPKTLPTRSLCNSETSFIEILSQKFNRENTEYSMQYKRFHSEEATSISPFPKRASVGARMPKNHLALSTTQLMRSTNTPKPPQESTSPTLPSPKLKHLTKPTKPLKRVPLV